MGDCLTFLHRFCMFLFCSVLLVAGAAGLVVGVWTMVSPHSVPVVLQVGDTRLQELASYSLMAAGPAMFLLGLLGCIAASKNSRCLRTLFFVVALVAMGTQAAGLAFALGFPEELAGLLGPEMAEMVKEQKNLILTVTGALAALEVLSMFSSMRLVCIDRKQRRNNPLLPVRATRRNSPQVRETTSSGWCSSLKKLRQVRLLCKALCFCKGLLILALLMWVWFK